MAHAAHQHALLHTAKGLTKEHFKVVADHPVPAASKGELLVRVKAAALNPVDWKMANIGFIIQSYPVVLGCDLAGVVEHVGEGVTDFKVGDEVYAFTKLGSHRQGAFQQFAVVEARMASHKPKALSFAQAATIGVGALTAGARFYTLSCAPIARPRLARAMMSVLRFSPVRIVALTLRSRRTVPSYGS